MRRQALAILVLVLLVLGPFQNCSLHQSEGRKQLESFLTRHSSDESCAPFLFDNLLVNYFSPGNSFDQVKSRRIGDQCVITAVNSVDTDAIPEGETEIYSCGLNDDPTLQSLVPSNIAASYGAPVSGEVYTVTRNGAGNLNVAAVATTAAFAGALSQFGFAVQGAPGYLDYFFISKIGPVRFKCQAASISTPATFNGSIRNEISKRAGGITLDLDIGLNP